MMVPPAPDIGTLNEKPLHAALKAWYARPGDRLEVEVEGFVVDVVRGDLLVEIQTGSFASIKRKLVTLVADHSLRLVYPVARDRWIVKVAAEASGRPGRRKSPRHGGFVDLFAELVSFPGLIANPNFSLEVLLIEEEELRRHEEGRAWRRKGWVTQERRLLYVLERRLFEAVSDLCTLLPGDLAEPWTTADLAAALGVRRRLAQQMAYCLRRAGALVPVGKEGRAILYERHSTIMGTRPAGSVGTRHSTVD
jgi:hypothetical protein